jgi:hypothetical protein
VTYNPNQGAYNQTIEDEGSAETQRGTLNFVGAGVSVADTGGKTTVTIAGGAGEAFPVGAVFIAVVSTSPATLLGYGTWSAFGAGRVLVGLDSGDTDFDTVEETGGAKTVAASAQTFAGNALATHQHAAVSAGTPAGTNAAEAAHTHTYGTIAHTHGLSGILRTATTGGATTHVAQTVDSSSTADTVRTTDSTGSATSPTGAGSSHTHTFTGDALGTHQHDAISAGTPAGTNTPGAATSVVQPYIVCYFWKRTA